MSRRTNLNTVRRSFLWNSNWMTNDDVLYNKLLWIDYKINEYLIGLFYSLKLPSSNYVIRRFFDDFVIVEADVYFFNTNRFVGFSKFKYYLYYFLFKFRSFFFSKKKSRRFNRKYQFRLKFKNSYFFSFLRNTFFYKSIRRYHICFLPELPSFFSNVFFMFLNKVFFLFSRLEKKIFFQLNSIQMLNRLRYLNNIFFVKSFFLF